MHPLEYDVVISGTGPTGLMLACELGLAGVRVAVLERLTEAQKAGRSGPLSSRILTVPTVEALDRRGLLPELRKAQQATLQAYGLDDMPDDPPTDAPRMIGHFSLILLRAEQLDTADPDFAGRFPEAECGFIGREEFEAMLATRATELGVTIHYGTELTDLSADPEGVTVTAGTLRIRGQWLVGCDGGRSPIRKLARFPFPGTDPEFTAIQAVAELDTPLPVRAFTDAGTVGCQQMPDGTSLIAVTEFGRLPEDRDSPVTPTELQDALHRVNGTPVRVTALHAASRYTDTTRQAADYRAGHILLAGDAAHVHPPYGGQGLNLGIGDAVNLGWKLAATIQGRAPEGLLDTYTTERHPIGAWVQRWTMAQSVLLRPEPRIRALRHIVTDLLDNVPATTYVVKKVAGVWQAHDLPGTHPLTGRPVPELPLDDGTRLADHFHPGRAVLLNRTGNTLPTSPWSDQLTLVTDHSATGPAALLARPDGVVAWATDGENDPEGLTAALRTWLGPGYIHRPR
ncbi:FAD-dependent oxidoreductase [Streptomyces ehimensis]|uniref:FAD-dependent oxidoreductase n=1 Tax=Streptomyces ehimensis TaxID=68195 RepID=A0ABV9BTV7_9ACTN